MCFVRKILDFVYTQYELMWIDDLLPGAVVENTHDVSQQHTMFLSI